MNKYFDNKPPGAKDFFFGDESGRSGWTIDLEDGTEGRIFVDIGALNVHVDNYFHQKRLHHKGQPVDENGFANCAKLYWNFLKELVDLAEVEFITNQRYFTDEKFNWLISNLPGPIFFGLRVYNNDVESTTYAHQTSKFLQSKGYTLINPIEKTAGEIPDNKFGEIDISVSPDGKSFKMTLYPWKKDKH